ncbi:MAG: hypothetical protein A3J37_02385 [Alphaproteobacteria bacterium RIFCSPHIGHO2_12_FULL_45_9]|nr:MAG: hypothetical protein A3B66_04390 [Alphaproteobacteria bacterium RIFCSPHIGHO2_02_FULL_46_13]OFW95515.1 MAG: hypothetical protein A3J37_02385 [Alphaproteobacteria bacterium RIFCSPHIGHO2_12_FULL_45_9]
MMKLKAQNLADAFGWMNVRARDFADSFGNRVASAFNVSLVLQAAGKINSVRGAFEIAAHAWKSVKPIGGTTGRPYRPTFAFSAPALEPR